MTREVESRDASVSGARPAPIAFVSLLTDFGDRDGYVAAMKARLLSLAPHVHVIDVSHAVAPGDVRAGAFLLARAAREFPASTVHVAVVDPGVGTARRAVAARASNGAWFVGPDNGLLGAVAADCSVCIELDPWRVTPGVEPSATFHGRDLFAPAAARLARGDSLDDLGSPAPAPSRLAPSVERTDAGWRGEVVWVDHFGNVITEIGASELPVPGARLRIRCQGLELDRLVTTFGDVGDGEALAYVGSLGTLELARRNGDLAGTHGIRRGDVVEVVVSQNDSPTPGRE